MKSLIFFTLLISLVAGILGAQNLDLNLFLPMVSSASANPLVNYSWVWVGVTFVSGGESIENPLTVTSYGIMPGLCFEVLDQVEHDTKKENFYVTLWSQRIDDSCEGFPYPDEFPPPFAFGEIFKQVVELGPYPIEKYEVWVNGERVHP